MIGDWVASLSADLNSWRCVGERIYLNFVSNVRRQNEIHVPAWRVVLEILALSLEHTASNLQCRRVILAGVGDVFDLADRISRIHHLTVVGDESVPFHVFTNGKRAFAELLGSIV